MKLYKRNNTVVGKINGVNLDKLIDHAIFNCIECNRFLTNLCQHYKQDKCRHKWTKLGKNKKGCTKCLKVVVKT